MEGGQGQLQINDIKDLILQLTNADQRENALLELSKRREWFPDLAPVMWHSFGTIAALLAEMISVYPMLSPPTLTLQASNRVCNALALLQCVASHPETRGKLMNAHIPLYLWPFLNTMSDEKPFEYLRLTSLGVIGALVKVDDSEVINFLLQTEIIPLCLRIMETGTELSKTVATFIVQKILLDDAGLQYVCATGERFYAVSQVLSSMVGKLLEGPSIRLLKHIVRCYLRLSEHAKARDALRQCLPAALRDQSFMNVFKSDESVQLLYYQMLKNLSTNESGETLPSNVGDSDAEEGFGVLDAQQQQLLQQQQGGVLPSSLFSPQEALGGIGLSPFYEHKPEVTAIKEDAVAEFK